MYECNKNKVLQSVNLQKVVCTDFDLIEVEGEVKLFTMMEHFGK